jgi:phage baseplate assembly protein W
MAFGAQQRFPNDSRPSIAVGVNLPFDGSSVFISNYRTKDAIKNNLINYFLTNPGERVANPTFGAGLREFIFEQISNNNLNFIKEDIQQKISVNFPDIVLNSVEILSSEDFLTINVIIRYSIPRTEIRNEELKFGFRGTINL